MNNVSSSPVIRRVTVDAMGGGTNSRGIYNVLSSPVLINITARASGATNNYGVYSTSSGSTIRIEQSRLIGATTIWNGSGVTTYVAHTRLQGGSVNNAGVLKCVGAYNGAFDALDGNCGLP